MSWNTEEENTGLLVDTIIKGIQEKKGHEIVVLDLTDIPNSICDYFVICHGDSNTQVEAIADSVEDETIKSLKEKPWHREGMENAEWVLLDYISVVVHVFYKQTREFYGLENLWADAKTIKYEDVY
jgi:ribosome-associated protein